MKHPAWICLPILVLVLIGFSASNALAQNPHFIRASASGPNNSGELTVSFKIAGLGSNVITTVTASADASAVYACINRGGKQPSDPKKEQVTGPVTASDDFSSGKNGQINDSLTLSPPPSTLNCPPGQRETLLELTYTNVKVSEPSAGTENIPGTFTL